MDNSVYNWMKEWSNLANKEQQKEDFWIETPFGSFKNPKFIPQNNDEEVGEITFTIKYEERKDKVENKIKNKI
jgi:hypothetical protein